MSSARHDDVLYLVDDGPGTTGVLAISAENARTLGRLEVQGLSGTDTEALAAGSCTPDPGRCIYIGDIGDNTRRRDTVVVHRFREPAQIDGPAAVAGTRVTLRYPDGPHDAEALLVDAQGRLGIITKGDQEQAPRLFVASEFRNATLADRGHVDVPLPALPLAAAAVGNVVTGADWAPGRVALRTYDAIFEYRAPEGRGGLRRFARWPVTEVPAAAEAQGEAVAYGSDGCTLFTVSEGSGALTASRCR